MFSIGQLSRRTGVKVPTIRYYEELGLLASEGRTAGNQRRYSRQGLDRLGFIRHARDLGLPLDDIRRLIEMDDTDHAEAHRIAEHHLADIRARIARLQRLETELARIATACDAGEDAPCRIVEAFGDHSQCEDDSHGAAPVLSPPASR